MSFPGKIKKAMFSSENRTVRKVGGGLYRAFLSFNNSRFMDFFHYKPYQDDRKYLENEFVRRFGVRPDFDDPKTFNEKRNWCKLYDRRDVYTEMVDKYRAKEFIEKRCGSGYTAKLLGVWDDPAKIDFDALPEQFVLKANHAGGIFVCRDKAAFDREGAVRKLKKQLRHDYYLPEREWPYKNVKRKVIAEEYLGDALTEYKNLCFNGKVVYTFAYVNDPSDGKKPQNHFCGAYDREWNKTELVNDYHVLDRTVEKPARHEEMLRLAEKLAEGTSFLRVDCFCIGDRLCIGEMTFSPTGGFMAFNDGWDERLGALETLPERT